MIARIFLFLVSLYVLIFISLSAFFYISLPLIEWKTKEKFGDGFFYVLENGLKSAFIGAGGVEPLSAKAAENAALA